MSKIANANHPSKQLSKEKCLKQWGHRVMVNLSPFKSTCLLIFCVSWSQALCWSVALRITARGRKSTKKWVEFNSLDLQINQWWSLYGHEVQGLSRHVWFRVRVTCPHSHSQQFHSWMFILVTELIKQVKYNKSRVSVQTLSFLLPPCVTGAFLTNMTSVAACSCVNSHEVVVSRADSVSRSKPTIDLSENSCETTALLPVFTVTEVPFWHLSTVPSHSPSLWRRGWARIRRRGGFPR